jgi:glutathione S-transferase
LWPVEGVVNVLDQPASRSDFLAGQTFTAGDVYVGSHLRFDLPHRQKQGAAEQDLQFASPRNAERTKSRAGWRSLG